MVTLRKGAACLDHEETLGWPSPGLKCILIGKEAHGKLSRSPCCGKGSSSL